MQTPGTLYIVATPIGCLEDFSIRATHVLQKVSLIAAEDTRRAQNLLRSLGFQKKILSLHDHNEQKQQAACINHLLSGNSLALITDAGTPLISDPGYLLVKNAHENQIPVCPIPGPCAAITALSASGLCCPSFKFLGFPPRKIQELHTYLSNLSSSEDTLIFYESPHRIFGLVKACLKAFPEKRLVCLARELTKTYEQIWRSSLGNLKDALENGQIPLKGEMVFLIEGTPKEERSSALKETHEAFRIGKLLQAVLPTSLAVQLTAQIIGAPRNQIYTLLHTKEKEDY